MATAQSLKVLHLHARTESERREAQCEMFNVTNCIFAMSPCGHWLERVLYKRGRVELKRGAHYVVHAGRRLRPVEIAHVLQVGPEGPIFDAGRFGAPCDGDHAHVHPSNWKPLSRGAAGRAAANRARMAAESSRLLPPGSRPGAVWYGPTGQQITDPRYWWSKAAASWGDTDRTLSSTWVAAPDYAPQHWAMCHHLAQRAREGTAAALASTAANTDARARALLALRRELDVERLALATGPEAARTRLVAVMRAARARGELPDSPDHAATIHKASSEDVHAHPAPTPAGEPGDLY